MPGQRPEPTPIFRLIQAEFLVHRSMPWMLVSEVGVYSDAARQRAEAILSSHGQGALPIRIQREWYY